MKYDVDYFIKKFEAIPEDKWIVGGFNIFGKKCAIGHCIDDNLQGYLINIFNKMSRVLEINDGDNPLYQQSTPKARILAALKDIKKAQND